MTSRKEQQAAMRWVLANSPRWQAETAKLDLMKVAAHPPVDMSDWTHDDFVSAFEWARERQDDIPPKLVAYLNEVQ